MADHRKPEIRIVLETPDGRQVAELFPAGQFAVKAPGNHAGRYRVRIDGVWFKPGGQEYSFLTLWEAFFALGGLVGEYKADAAPDLPMRTYVRAPSSYLEGMPMYTRTYTKSLPFQGVDGRWRVLCSGLPEPVLCEDIIKVEVKRK